MNSEFKPTAYIGYGNDFKNVKLGSFDKIPDDKIIAIIALNIPDKDGKRQTFTHYKLCGTKITASMFLGVYSTQVPVSTLVKIKEEINNGQSVMFIPLGKSLEDYIWIDEKASVYETPEEFRTAIHDFKDMASSQFNIQDENNTITK